MADAVGGPYRNVQQFLRSGMSDLSEDGVTNYDAQVHPNVVDPQTFFDHAGNLWMIYGSHSGGIFILAMDETTGLPEPGQGYGKHLLGGNHARIEGAYVIDNATTGFYYLFTSFGGLDANRGYNIRVARSQAPDGPYFDAAGTDMGTVRGNPGVPFDDTRIAPYGQKLMGNYQYALATGESGTAVGYVSPGHNSAYHDTVDDRYFHFFHTRFPGRGEVHEVRVHELCFNSQGWPVTAPLRYAPLSLALPAVSADVTNDSVPGAVTGTWLHRGSNLIDLTVGGATFNGVLSRQWNPNANRFVVTFSAQSSAGVSVWGARTSD